MTLVTAANLSKGFGERTLFSGVSFNINSGERIGLIGANGTGKTTLFNMILGEMPPDEGGFSRKSNLKIGYLQQHAPSDSLEIAYEEALKVFAPVIELEKELEQVEKKLLISDDPSLLNKQATLREKFISLGGLTYKNRTRATLLGLGLGEERLTLPVSALSGGQRSKIGLAKLLLSDPELILLDEPTNHLDVNAIMWLENYLNGVNAAVLVISHDRYFLDRVTSRTFEIVNGGFLISDGSYSRHKELVSEQKKALQRDYEKKQKEIKRIEGIIEQQKTFSMERNYRTIEHKQKSIDRIKKDLVAPEKEESEIRFNFKVNSDCGNNVLRAEHLTKCYGALTLYKDIDLDIKKNSNVFLLGPNGSGKTTLLKDLLRGAGVLGARVSVGYFDQLGANLCITKTVFDEIHDAYPALNNTEVRNALAAFLFTGDSVFNVISDLSGGERARVALCKLMLSGNNLLFLDEPTNHLDIKSREALENALKNYGGTIIAVSHDRYFINCLATDILWLEGGKLQKYHGSYDDFFEKYYEKPDEEKPPKKEMGEGGKKYLRGKEARQKLRRLKANAVLTERRIDDNDMEIRGISDKLQEPDVAADYKKVDELTSKITELQQLNDELMETWGSLLKEVKELEECL